MLLSSQNKTNETLLESDTFILYVGGMKCAGCVKAVERQLMNVPAIKRVSVNLMTQVAIVESIPGMVDPQEIAVKLTKGGFPTEPKSDELLPSYKQGQETQKQYQKLIIAVILLVLSGLGHLPQLTIPILDNIWFHALLATISVWGPGRFIWVDGAKSWWNNAPNMNTLVGLGTLTAFLSSWVALLFPSLNWECFFDEPVMLVGFILLGKTLEQKAKGEAASAFENLLSLQPNKVHLIVDRGDLAKSLEIPVQKVGVGDWLQVLPGERIPVDGFVVAGNSTVNESMLTGEALPVWKYPPESVTSGTLNESGVMVIEATKTGGDTTLAMIISFIETAQTRRAPIQSLADGVAGFFAYGVMAIALITFIFWYLIGTEIWPMVLDHHYVLGLHHYMSDGMSSSKISLSLKLAIAVLVIACPCALGLATPTAILVGTGLGAERGLLIKGGDVLQRIHELDTVIFDKTGTLTKGEPRVTNCVGFSDYKYSVLQLAAAIESGTSHPIAKAIIRATLEQGISIPEAFDFYTEPGLGVGGVIEGKLVRLGSPIWFNQLGIKIPDYGNYADSTLVLVAVDDECIGLIQVEDEVKLEAKLVVTELQKMGLQVLMMTGDSSAVALKIADQVGIDFNNIMAQVLPTSKAQVIANLQSQGRVVAMIGDGINDAPALSQADVGVSMSEGTDIAIDTSQVVLLGDKLTDLVSVINLGRATFNKIRQNLFWAFGYNLLGLPIAAGVLLPMMGIMLSPASAGALMAFSSVSVVTNSIFLRFLRKNWV